MITTRSSFFFLRRLALTLLRGRTGFWRTPPDYECAHDASEAHPAHDSGSPPLAVQTKSYCAAHNQHGDEKAVMLPTPPFVNKRTSHLFLDSHCLSFHSMPMSRLILKRLYNDLGKTWVNSLVVSEEVGRRQRPLNGLSDYLLPDIL